MKGNQFDKIICDTMKMILIEKILGKSFRKILAVCDVDIEMQLNGSSWKSLVLKEFAVEVVRVNIGHQMLNKIRLAQEKQYR